MEQFGGRKRNEITLKGASIEILIVIHLLFFMELF